MDLQRELVEEDKLIQESKQLRDELNRLALQNTDGTAFTIQSQSQGQGATPHRSDLIKQNIPLHTYIHQVPRASADADRESFKSKQDKHYYYMSSSGGNLTPPRSSQLLLNVPSEASSPQWKRQQVVRQPR